MFDHHQFRDLINRTLSEMGIPSRAATELLMGTCAQESRMGTYLRQIHGPAMGCMQIEPATFEWLKTKYYNRFWRQIEPITFPELEWNLKASIVMARLRYLADPEPLPPAEDIAGLAKVWKRVYNTPLGAGTVDEFVRNHHTYCS